MQQLGAFLFFFRMATLSGIGLIVMVGAAVLLARAGRFKPALLVLPALWLAPLVVGAVFIQPVGGVKSADWLGGLGWAAFATFCAVALGLFVLSKAPRWLVGYWALANGMCACLGVMVTSMASTGTWL